jgi:hypothetical protein
MSAEQADSLATARRDAVTANDPSQGIACPDPTKTWIAIVLEEDGVGVPNEEYLITAPDGSEHSGVLDEKGYARVDGIDPGTCQITFPLLDQGEWSPK